MIKSTIKQLTPINFDKEIVINVLRADPKAVEMHTKRLTDLFPNDTLEQRNMKIQNIIIRENVFNSVMEETARSFETTYDEEEVNKLKDSLKAQIAQMDPMSLDQIARRIITKSLIFTELAKQWNITVTDQDVDQSLEQYYKVSTNPIRDYKTDKNKYENVRNVLYEEKITTTLIHKFTKVKIDWDTIKAKQSKPN